MSATQEDVNKAAVWRLNEALNCGDADVVAAAIDDAFQPDVLIRTPLRIDAHARR